MLCDIKGSETLNKRCPCYCVFYLYVLRVCLWDVSRVPSTFALQNVALSVSIEILQKKAENFVYLLYVLV